MDVLAYSIGSSLPWGGIGICIYWVLQRNIPRDVRWRPLIYAIPPLAGGLGSWTGFQGHSIFFPVLTALIWGAILYLAVRLAKNPDASKERK
jgi:hypothetical protein